VWPQARRDRPFFRASQRSLRAEEHGVLESIFRLGMFPCGHHSGFGAGFGKHWSTAAARSLMRKLVACMTRLTRREGQVGAGLDRFVRLT
jgi:hypothetical protein